MEERLRTTVLLIDTPNLQTPIELIIVCLYLIPLRCNRPPNYLQ